MKRLKIFINLLIRTKLTALTVIILSFLFVMPFFISIISSAFANLCEKEAINLYGEFDNIYFGEQISNLVADQDRIELSDYIEYYGTIKVGDSYGKIVLGSIDSEGVQLGHIRLVRGCFPKKEHEICITESLFYEYFYDYDINSEVVIGEKHYVISGIINDYYIAWNKKNLDERTLFPNILIVNTDESDLREQITLIKNIKPFPISLYENKRNLVANTNATNGNASTKYLIPDFVFGLLYVSITIVIVYLLLFVKRRDFELKSILKQLGSSYISLQVFSGVKLFFMAFISVIGGWIIAQVLSRGFIFFYGFNNSGKLEYPVANELPKHFNLCILVCLVACVFVLLSANLMKRNVFVSHGYNLTSGRKMLIVETIRSGKSIVISSIVIAVMLVMTLVLSMYLKMYIASRSNVFGKMPKDYDYQFSTNQEFEDYSYIDEKGTQVTVKSLPEEDAIYFMPNHLHVIDHKTCEAMANETSVKKVLNYIDANDVYLRIDKAKLNNEYLQGFPVENQITEEIANILNINSTDNIYRNAQFCGFPKEDIENLTQYVREGTIDYNKIVNGEEIILIVPVYERVTYDDGSWAINYLEYKYYNGKSNQFSDHTFKVGETIELFQIIPKNPHMAGYINAIQLKQDTELVKHKVKIGAILYERVMWFDDSSQLPTAYTFIGAEETFSNMGIKPSFSRTQIYLDKKTDYNSFEPVIHKYQYELEDFVYTNNAAELKDYRRFMMQLQEICFTLIFSSFCLMIIITISETYISYIDRRSHYAMLRVLGMSPIKYLNIILCRIITIWFLSTTIFLGGELCLVKHIWGNLNELDLYLGKGFLLFEVLFSFLIITGIVAAIYSPLLRKYVNKYSWTCLVR